MSYVRRWDHDHVWHPFTQMAEYAAVEPLIIERAEGCWLIDVEGRRYLDGVSSLWCNVHGHRRPEIDAAIREQLDRVAHSTLLGASNVPAVRLARKLVELAERLSASERGGERERQGSGDRGQGSVKSSGGKRKRETSTQGAALPTAHCALPSASRARPLAQSPTRPVPPLTRVFFSDDGATAVEVALKMAFQYWQQRPPHRNPLPPAGGAGRVRGRLNGGPRPKKTKFVSLGGAYHGDTLGDVSVGGVELFHRMFGPLLFPTYRAPEPFCYRCPLGLQRASCAIDCLTALERVLEEHHDEIAAVVVEPLVQGAAGMIVAPEGYLRGVREATLRHDVLLIADEVAVGIGRTGTMFACEQEGVVPDFLCLAKGLTGGYLPLAATLTHDEIYRAFLGTHAERRTFFHGHTYGGNALGAAAALATLEIFEREGTLERIKPRIAQLARWLKRLAELRHVGDVRQRGLMAGVELVRDRKTKQPYDWTEQMAARVCRRARDDGVLLRPLGNVIVLMPPLAISEEEMELLCGVVERAIGGVTEGDDEGMKR